MSALKKYINFCKKFHNTHLPELKFKDLNERYSQIYKNLYDIDKDDINKASFIIGIISFTISFLISISIINLNILIIILYSVIFSLFFSYKFNLIIFKDINKKEVEINALLYLIKIDFSLIKKTLEPNSDFCLSFIKLIKEYRLPILSQFKKVLVNIHEGENPEDELMKVLTPSKDFDSFLKNILINNFDDFNSLDNFAENTLEKNFKIYLKDIQSKISIIFFIGVFFPIGLCFLILFQIVNIFTLLFLIPTFLLLLNFLCRKFIKKNSYMIGVLNDFSGLEKKKFDEFLLFLSSFAVNLKNNLSPEMAFLRSYSQNKNLYLVLNNTFRNQLSRLLNFNCSFFEMIRFIKHELNSMRYSVILDLIEKLVSHNPYDSTEKIFEILNILNTHQKLDKKLEVIIKGEKFKIFFFIFLLPILIGAISGMFPFFNLITRDIILINYDNLMNIYYTILIFFVFTSSISITSRYFLEVIKYRRKFLIIIISNLIFILTFLSSFINVLNFI